MLPQIITPIPGPRSREYAAKLGRYESRNVTFLAPDFPVFWERAEGPNVWDVDGNCFLDLTSAFGVASWGHSPPELRAAISDQANQLWHAMGDVHPVPAKAVLCETLSSLTFERWGLGPARSILGNSGFEGVEAALKTSLLYTGKPGVIIFEGAYHGLGLGALETCGMPFFRAPFRSQLGKFAATVPYSSCYRCPFGSREPFRLEGHQFPNCSSSCLETLRARLDELIQTREIGAILVEPIQGRGGEVVPPLDFLPLLRQVCDEHKILLIFDEIYTGFWRTGKLFACDHFQVRPDLICLGKALTGGFPLSACVGRREIMDAWPVSSGEALHTSTFLGNPLGCRMALESCAKHAGELEAPTLPRAMRQWEEALKALCSPALGDCRGVGFLYGLELVHPDGTPWPELAAAIMVKGLADGLIVLAGGIHGNVVSLSPPFSMEPEEIGFGVGKLQEYLTSLPGSIS